MTEYLTRKMDEYLLKWKARKNHKPLIVKGARQIGKTKTIEHFGENYYESFIEINFVEEPIYKSIVSDGYSPDMIKKNIIMIDRNKKFIDGKTLIFFDEFQEFPDITTALKFFSLDGRYDVICSGSLLGTNYKEISSISVGFKEEIEMYSLDFEEFLWANGFDKNVKNEILQQMVLLKPFSATPYQVFSNLFMDFCVVGGMPEVVKDFIETGTYENTLSIQKNIVIGYEGDIKKYAEGLDKARIINVFRSIPYQLGKENKKFQISKVARDARFRDYRGTIEWLEDAGVINVNRALNTLDLPLKGNIIENNFIVYFADSGLLLSQLDEESQADFLQNKNFGIYKGGFYESVIAETLVKSGYELHYYKKEDSTLEEEFLVRNKDYIVPIEVKSTNSKAKSLQNLIKSDSYKNIKYGIKIIKGNIGYASNIISFPHFCSFCIKDFLSAFDYKEIVD